MNLVEPKCAPPSKVPEHSSSADMRPDSKLKLKSECFAINRLQLLEYEYHTALDDLKKDQISFSILSDVCLPVSLLILVIVWSYQLNAMTIDTDSGDNRMMLLVCGVGLIVVSGTACVYIAIRMSVMRPEVEVTTFLQGELKPLYSEKNRSQCLYYQTIPGIHRTGKKQTDIFIV
ncbi:hypothetical protein AGLY_003738 [Aphis glycines]|uniref:Uncharacterized protein n=1 Tax=Aphis glycines TaxID=307491 RepID=A0A6G0U0F7_APHGL|nr:hypothetical protein AGLY_003738 [Aphis glycines]